MKLWRLMKSDGLSPLQRKARTVARRFRSQAELERALATLPPARRDAFYRELRPFLNFTP